MEVGVFLKGHCPEIFKCLFPRDWVGQLAYIYVYVCFYSFIHFAYGVIFG
jgi:hypothetical protein